MAGRGAPERRPQEPNRAALALGLVLVVLAGIAGAWFFTRGGDDASDDLATDTSELDATDTTADAALDPLAEPEPVPFDGPPTVVFDEVGGNVDRANADGSGQATVLPGTISFFSVDDTGTKVAYVGTDD